MSPNFTATARDDVTGEPVSELALHGWFGDSIRVTITPVDPDLEVVSHWLSAADADALAHVILERR